MSGYKGNARSVHTGLKGANSVTYKYGSGRSDSYWNKAGSGAIGSGHGHTVRYNGFPVYSRTPGTPKKDAWSLFSR